MSADTTPLAQRLLERASVHAWSVTSAETPEQIEAIAQHSVVAFLRELAEDRTIREGGEDVGGRALFPEHLRALADSIEKGGADE